MRFSAAINVSAPDGAWDQICPDARQLARKTARLAVIDGMAAMDLAPPARAELGITLTADDFQQQLNQRFRGRSASTNILAFPAWEPAAQVPFGAPLLLGDLVLAFETVASEALNQGKAFADHFRHLIVHGVLHLLGWDHQSEAEAAEMEVLETLILTRLGVPNPYAD
jgi:probable rRNA maturation factor